jgi:hypothetical protein
VCLNGVKCKLVEILRPGCELWRQREADENTAGLAAPKRAILQRLYADSGMTQGLFERAWDRALVDTRFWYHISDSKR